MNALAISDARYFAATKIMYCNTPSTKNCQFVIQGVNDTFLNSNKKESQSDIVIVKVLENNNWGCFKSFPDRIKTLTNIEDVVKLAKNCFSEKQTLFNRLVQLIHFFYDEEDEGEISIESLKSMLIFFSSIKPDFNTPSMTLNENGYFEVDWRKSNFELITLRFREENNVDYLVFKPSQYTEKPIILNNSINLFDSIELIKDLKLMHLIKK